MPQKLLKELILNPEHSFKCPNTIKWASTNEKFDDLQRQNSFFNYGSVIYSINVIANAKWVTQNTVAYSLELDM